VIEAPCSKLQGIFDRKECRHFLDSLAYPAASCGECARYCGSTLENKYLLGFKAGRQNAMREGGLL
jgi:hypothetical protein